MKWNEGNNTTSVREQLWIAGENETKTEQIRRVTKKNDADGSFAMKGMLEISTRLQLFVLHVCLFPLSAIKL